MRGLPDLMRRWISRLGDPPGGFLGDPPEEGELGDPPGGFPGDPPEEGELGDPPGGSPRGDEGASRMMHRWISAKIS